MSDRSMCNRKPKPPGNLPAASEEQPLPGSLASFMLADGPPQAGAYPMPGSQLQVTFIELCQACRSGESCIWCGIDMACNGAHQDFQPDLVGETVGSTVTESLQTHSHEQGQWQWELEIQNVQTDELLELEVGNCLCCWIRALASEP